MADQVTSEAHKALQQIVTEANVTARMYEDTAADIARTLQCLAGFAPEQKWSDEAGMIRHELNSHLQAWRENEDARRDMLDKLAVHLPELSGRLRHLHNAQQPETADIPALVGELVEVQVEARHRLGDALAAAPIWERLTVSDEGGLAILDGQPHRLSGEKCGPLLHLLIEAQGEPVPASRIESITGERPNRTVNRLPKAIRTHVEGPEPGRSGYRLV